MTSLAGGAFDLAGYLVLPVLVAAVAAWTSAGRRARIAWIGLAVLGSYTILITATFTAIAALGAGLLVLGAWLLPRRRFLAALAALMLIGLLAASVDPLRPRVEKKLGAVARGEVNKVLTGRLDPWRAALWMAREEPATGVGQGAFRAAFGHARLALVAEGVEFYRGQKQTYFVNAHSDLLEALAEWGVPGLLAVLCAGGLFARGLLRSIGKARIEGEGAARGRPEAALAIAAGLALGVMALTYFPFHLALVAYPWLLFASGPLSLGAPPAPSPDPGSGGGSAAESGGGTP
ncbi:MAG: O-antigen ligase family protein [Holophagales bacterium]|nr:O-antigen ligase family protein [Holophagales bacterium]